MFDKLLYFLGLGEITATKCGHKTKAMERIEIMDKKDRIIVGRIENTRDPKFCIDCLKKRITISDVGNVTKAKLIL